MADDKQAELNKFLLKKYQALDKASKQFFSLVIEGLHPLCSQHLPRDIFLKCFDHGTLYDTFANGIHGIATTLYILEEGRGIGYDKNPFKSKIEKNKQDIQPPGIKTVEQTMDYQWKKFTDIVAKHGGKIAAPLMLDILDEVKTTMEEMKTLYAEIDRTVGVGSTR